jgi:hypothetical protein
LDLQLPISSTNKTDCHDIAELLLKVTLNTMKQTNYMCLILFIVYYYRLEKEKKDLKRELDDVQSQVANASKKVTFILVY